MSRLQMIWESMNWHAHEAQMAVVQWLRTPPRSVLRRFPHLGPRHRR